jgi:flagellar motor protein MotB
VRNLVKSLQYENDSLPISEDFTRQIRQSLDNLHDKQNVTVRLIGYTDDAPLIGQDDATYGDHLSLSKAMANRVALGMEKTLGLPSSAIQSDGRGASHPLASNGTVEGRALNRRIR